MRLREWAKNWLRRRNRLVRARAPVAPVNPDMKRLWFKKRRIRVRESQAA